MPICISVQHWGRKRCDRGPWVSFPCQLGGLVSVVRFPRRSDAKNGVAFSNSKSPFLHFGGQSCRCFVPRTLRKMKKIVRNGLTLM